MKEFHALFLCNRTFEKFCFLIYFIWILDCCSELFGEKHGCNSLTEGYRSVKSSIPGKIMIGISDKLT